MILRKCWKVKRWVLEEFEVFAETREEALGATVNPHSIHIRKETCVRDPENDEEIKTESEGGAE